MSTIRLTTTGLPSVVPSYLRSILPRRGAGNALPVIATSWKGAVLNPGHVAKYRDLCALSPSNGATDADTVPLLYPHTFLGPIHLRLLTHSAFPFGLLGSVHARNHIVQYAPLTTGAPFDVELRLCGGRRRPQGIEFEIETVVSVAGETRWASSSTFLVRRRFDDEDAEAPLAATVPATAGAGRPRVGQFAVPPDAGRRFGWLTKDVNPIHMSPLAARAFGFERDLCHGMWGLSRALPYLTGVDQASPVRIDCAFKGPMYMERDVRVHGDANAAPAAAAADAKAWQFELFSGENPRPSVAGAVRNVLSSEELHSTAA